MGLSVMGPTFPTQANRMPGKSGPKVEKSRDKKKDNASIQKFSIEEGGLIGENLFTVRKIEGSISRAKISVKSTSYWNSLGYGNRYSSDFIRGYSYYLKSGVLSIDTLDNTVDNNRISFPVASNGYQLKEFYSPYESQYKSKKEEMVGMLQEALKMNSGSGPKAIMVGVQAALGLNANDKTIKVILEKLK